MTEQLPLHAYRYFWDIDPAHLDVDEYPVYVIERLLEYGDLPSVRWMLRHFPREEVVAVLQASRRLSPLSGNFWALYFGLEKERVSCLSKLCRSEPDTIWPY